MEELKHECERTVGQSLAIEFGSTASLKKKIEMGEAFDVTIVTADAIGDLIKQGRTRQRHPRRRAQAGHPHA